MPGIGLTVVGYFLFTFHDAGVKWLVATLPVWEVLFFRSVVIILGCLVIGRGPMLRRAIDTPLRRQLLWRGVVILSA